MILPPANLTIPPSVEQIQLALNAHMEYKRIYSDGKLVGWKLMHKKEKRPCGC